jgi:nucleoside-diphosphate-sugar epimerase
MTNPADTTVLVTGATGFIANHCILQLLDAGYRVRGTARSTSRAAQLEPTLKAHLADPDASLGRFELVAADLTKDDGWDAAVAGCTYVLHIASPLPRTPPKNDDELIVPARDGALRVLKAAAEAGVKRVVLTSSVAAVIYGHDRSQTFNESSWTDLSSKKMGAYERSKTIAERAAWDFMDSLDGSMELVAINPGLVLGPVLDADWGTSGEVIKKIMDGDFPAIPDLNFPLVDVRDVASAHISAMTTPEAAGERFICVDDTSSMREVAKLLAENYGEKGFKIRTGNLPNFALRIIAVFDATARLALNDLGVQANLDTSKISSTLEWNPRGLEEMVTAMAQSFIDYGIVKAK